jgi:hypothetical protein
MPEAAPGEIPGDFKMLKQEALKYKNKIDRKKTFCSFDSKAEPDLAL